MSIERKLKKVETFISPAGLVEQRWRVVRTLDDVLLGLKDLEKAVDKAVKEQKTPALILADLSELTKVDLSRRMLRARKEGVDLMRRLPYERAALYGPLAVQLMVTTMALVAGKHHKIRVFEKRAQAVKWLRNKQKPTMYHGESIRV